MNNQTDATHVGGEEIGILVQELEKGKLLLLKKMFISGGRVLSLPPPLP